MRGGLRRPRRAHIRENDLLLEVVDGAGRPVPDGIEGELAFTTLTRTAMPLIRYRTGDRSALLPGRCPCGCAMRRIAPPRRMEGGALSLAAWDEALLPLPGLSDFRITLRGGEVLLEAEGSSGPVRPSPPRRWRRPSGTCCPGGRSFRCASCAGKTA